MQDSMKTLGRLLTELSMMTNSDFSMPQLMNENPELFWKIQSGVVTYHCCYDIHNEEYHLWDDFENGWKLDMPIFWNIGNVGSSSFQNPFELVSQLMAGEGL